MAPLPHDQDITSWPQLLSAIEDAEAGQGTARLTEICLSVYSALAAAQFQIIPAQGQGSRARHEQARRSHSPAGKVTGCGAISGVPMSSWICACAVRGMSRGLPW